MRRRFLLTAVAVLLTSLVSACSGNGQNLQPELDAAEERAARYDAQVEALKLDVLEAKREARQAEETARAKVDAENAAALQAIAAAGQEVEKAKAAVAAREEAVSAAEVAKRAQQFGDGIHEVGVDIQPGKYKTDGASGCYWAKQDRAGEIIDNENGIGPQVVIIESTVFAFKSSRCGIWTKTG
jgi:multidrug efflux pump subunit AcrA (membrane-fusion protein)